ncbi:MAG: tetratricopeptide repeat protein, partial [Bdellovibrionota bacterium]
MMKTRIFAVLSWVLITGCSSASKKPPVFEPTPEAAASSATDSKSAETSAKSVTPSEVKPISSDPVIAENEQLRSHVFKLTNRIESLETKLNTLTDKVDVTRANFELIQTQKHQKSLPTETKASAPSLKASPIAKMPSDTLNGKFKVLNASNDPEAGFANDEPIQSYRNAMVQFQAGKYPNSILSFSAFLEKFPDHPLAGAAQFYSGESYFKQKEYKLAIQEFQKVLTSYDRSTHISETLRQIARAEEHANLMSEATKHRQLLSSLFPQSPAAAAPQSQEAEISNANESTPQESNAPEKSHGLPE